MEKEGRVPEEITVLYLTGANREFVHIGPTYFLNCEDLGLNRSPSKLPFYKKGK